MSGPKTIAEEVVRALDDLIDEAFAMSAENDYEITWADFHSIRDRICGLLVMELENDLGETVAERVTDKPITARLIKEVRAELHPAPAAPRIPTKNLKSKDVVGTALSILDQIEQAVREGQKTDQVLQLLAILRERLKGAALKSNEDPTEVHHNNLAQTL